MSYATSTKYVGFQQGVTSLLGQTRSSLTSVVVARTIDLSEVSVIGGIPYRDVLIRVDGINGWQKVYAVPEKFIPEMQVLVYVDMTWDEDAEGGFIFHNIRAIEPCRPVGVMRSSEHRFKLKEFVLWELEHATTSIFIMAYSFTCFAYAKALVAAHRAGIEVSVITDRNQYQIERERRNGKIDYLLEHGVPVLLADGIAPNGYQHEKMLIVDYGTERVSSAIGSANFSDASYSRNREFIEFSPYDRRKAKICMDEFIDAHNQAYPVKEGFYAVNNNSACRLLPRQ